MRGSFMELEQKELDRIKKISNWSNSRSRRILLIALLIILGCIFLYFIIMHVVGCIAIKELLWIIFFLLVIVVWCKVIFDLERNIQFLLKIIEKLRK